MILDGHIHVGKQEPDQADLLRKMKDGGVDGGILFSHPPADDLTCEQRLETVMGWCDGEPNLYPFLFINPMADDAADEVEKAVKAGIMGFKIIVGLYSIGEEKALEVVRLIARAGKPLLLHSGILWDVRPSSRFNRPAEFEVLMDVDKLKFALAHISWPWCDECLAVYGKILCAKKRRPDISAEMFIDTTPGTPPIYREDALTKLYTIGYDIENNVFFGTDGGAANYDSKWAGDWVGRDRAIFEKLELSSEVIKKNFSENLKRFVGVSKDEVVAKPPYGGK